MRPELKRIHSPDIADWEFFRPQDARSFAFLLQAMFGPDNGDGEEAFDLIVCTPKWLEQKVSRDTIISGRHHLVVRNTTSRKFALFSCDMDRLAEPKTGTRWH
jgi:hypothetical protein